MSARFACALAVSACAASVFIAPAHAQEEAEGEPRIDYRSGQYQFPTPSSAVQDDAVVTHTVPAGDAPLPAERVIPALGPRPDPIFVRSPLVQGSQVAAPAQTFAHVPATPAQAPAPLAVPLATYAPPAVYYTYPLPPAPAGAGAARVVYPAGQAQIAAPAYVYPQASAEVPATLPAGSRIVTFDASIWLTACRDRLAGYAPEDRDAAIAALGGAAAGFAPGRDHCQSYLDSYMASAAAGTLTVPQHYGQQYMLVPVTVLAVPQAASPNR